MRRQRPPTASGLSQARPGSSIGLTLVVCLLAAGVLLPVVGTGSRSLRGHRPAKDPRDGDQVVSTPAPATLREPVTTGQQSRPWPPTPTPSWTPSRTLTHGPIPLVLSVDSDVLAEYRARLSHLVAAFPGLELLKAPSIAVNQGVDTKAIAGATIRSGPEAPAGSVILCARPYAAVTHVQATDANWPIAKLRSLAIGADPAYTLVSGDAGAIERELFGVDLLSNAVVTTESWTQAKEYIATHPNTWGLLPWDAVDHRVRLVAVDGRDYDPEDVGSWPLTERVWLEGADLPSGLVKKLEAALSCLPEPSVELVAVGDIMLGRRVGELMSREGPDYPFAGEGISPLLRRADLSFGNLECPISDRGRRQPKAYTFRAQPDAVDGLLRAGFDVLCLANNHSGDYGDVALLDTLDLVEGADMVSVGAGRTVTEAHSARFVDVKGVRLAFLAYDQVGPSWLYASGDSPGSARLELERVLTEVRAARTKADVVIVSCHWGFEYRHQASSGQKRQAQAIADAGADLIIGHHPHVVQGVAYLRDAFVTYSLGNFVFDMGVVPATSEGVALRCRLDGTGVKSVELLPYALERYQPRLVVGQHGQRILTQVERVTQEWPR